MSRSAKPQIKMFVRSVWLKSKMVSFRLKEHVNLKGVPVSLSLYLSLKDLCDQQNHIPAYVRTG